MNIRKLAAPLLPYVLGAVAVAAGSGWVSQGCRHKQEVQAFDQKVKDLEKERDGAKAEAADSAKKAGSWETRAKGAEAVAAELRKAQRLTEAPEGAGVQVIKKGEVAEQDGVILDLGLGSDCSALLKARAEEITFKDRFDACQAELVPLKKSRGFWPTVRRGLPWVLAGAAGGYALGR